MRRLGGDWGFLVTDVGEGEAANDERLAYVFDRRAVRLAGLAGELVIAEEDFGSATPLRKQFARSPYMVSFEAGPPAKPVGFTLISLHVVFGNKPADRTPRDPNLRQPPQAPRPRPRRVRTQHARPRGLQHRPLAR